MQLVLEFSGLGFAEVGKSKNPEKNPQVKRETEQTLLMC